MHKKTKKIILAGFLLAGILLSAPSADARISRSRLRDLSNDDVVTNLRIPVLFGVAVRNLSDTWGDARSGGRTHEGIDIMAPRGALVVTPTEAIVTNIEDSGNGGKHVFTINPGGERFYYAHLDAFAEGLDEGDELEPGDLIGYVGNTGNAISAPPHLHFGIYQEDHQGAINPFPRLTLEFSLEDRIEALEKMLEDADDETAMARSLVNQYKNIFVEAQAKGIELPDSVTKILLEKKVDVIGITRTLRLGMSGDDVKLLQEALGVPADGSFGPGTRSALVAFQLKMGVSADGIFGPQTRALLANSSLAEVSRPAGCTATTIYSPTTGVKC